MLEKTYPTFHGSNLFLQQLLINKYYELISCFMVTEQNNEFLMSNHNLRSDGLTQFLEVNGTVFPEANATSSHKYGHGRGHGRS